MWHEAHTLEFRLLSIHHLESLQILFSVGNWLVMLLLIDLFLSESEKWCLVWYLKHGIQLTFPDIRGPTEAKFFTTVYYFLEKQYLTSLHIHFIFIYIKVVVPLWSTCCTRNCDHQILFMLYVLELSTLHRWNTYSKGVANYVSMLVQSKAMLCCNHFWKKPLRYR